MAGRADLISVPYWIMGFCSGIASALLFLTAATGSVIFGLPVFIAALPVFVAGLGWGAVAAGIAALTGMILLSFFHSSTAGLVFFVFSGATPFWLVRQALLFRPVTPAPSRRSGRERRVLDPNMTSEPIEWYSTGALVIWCTGIAVAFFIFATVGVSLAGYEDGLEEALRQVLVGAVLDAGWLDQLLRIANARDDTIYTLLITVLPATLPALWIILTLGNMWAAQALLSRFQLNLRPSPRLKDMQLPLSYMGFFAGAVALSLIPGETAYFGGTVAVILATPYFLLGFGVIHAISRAWTAWNARIVFLGLFYMLLLVEGWLIIPVWLLGLLDSGIGLRTRLSGGVIFAKRPRKSEENE